MTKHKLYAAHRRSSYHREEILFSNMIGCFHCLYISEFKDIKEWIDRGQTAMCPACGIDSLIGDKSGFPITSDFLSEMQDYWFGRTK